MSHSPFATLLPPERPPDPARSSCATRLGWPRPCHALAPDAVVVIGPDHFHANFYDVMPPFVLGVEEAVGFGDFGSASGPIPVARELAWSIQAGLADAGFDLVAVVLAHRRPRCRAGATRWCPAAPTLPLVPLVVNTAGSPAALAWTAVSRSAPLLARCCAGPTFPAGARAGQRRAVALAAVQRSRATRRSTGNRREALIHGRRDARAFAAVREPRVRAMGGDPHAPVNADWDEWFLRAVAPHDLSARHRRSGTTAWRRWPAAVATRSAPG